MSDHIRLRKGSRRNTQAHVLHMGPHAFFFSYETCVAYAGPAVAHATGCDSAAGARRDNHWGPTTGRHMSDMDVKGWPVVPDDVFEAILRAATEGEAPRW